MSELQLSDYLRDLLMDMSRLQAIVEEVDKHVADGTSMPRPWCSALKTGKVGRFQDSYAAVQKKLSDDGADPGRALNQD